jgi:hypothetical protein
MIFMLIIIWLLFYEFSSLDIVTISRLSMVILSTVILAVFFRGRDGKSPLSIVYTIVFCLFHFGLVLIIGLGLPLGEEFIHNYSFYWPDEKFVRQAIVIVDMALIALAVGVFLNGVSSSKSKVRVHINKDNFSTRLELISFLLLLSSFLFWLYLVVSSGGTSVFASSYVAFLAKTMGSFPVTILYFWIGLGLVLLVAVRGRFLKSGILIFTTFSFLALPLGLRGEVLFPLATVAALTILQGHRIPTRKALVGGLILLCLISAVRVVRQSGIKNYSVSVLDFLPHHALVELGGTLRSVAEVVSWANQGEPYMYGATFWAPFERALYYLLPFVDRVPADHDERLMNVVIAKRVSNIGFSPVSEGHRNLGILGVVLYMTFIGFVLGRLDIYGRSALGRCFAAVIFFPLLYEVRNSFVQVPYQIIFGLSIILIVLFVSIIPRSRSDLNFG